MNITLKIDDKLIINALSDALVSHTYGIGYWAKVGEFKSYEDLLMDGSVELTEIDENEKGYNGPVRFLNRSAILRGLKILSELPNKDIFISLLRGDTDGAIGDALIQCSVLGGIVYG